VKIGIIGAGMIGGTAARLFALVGHEVALSNSRGPDTLKDLVANAGSRVRAATVEDAAAFGEVVLLAIPLKAYSSLPRNQLAGKIVVDATNYYPARDGQIDFGGRSTTEFISRSLPDSRVVKAFNTMFYKTLGEAGRPGAPMGERLALFVAADDDAAGGRVAKLIEQIGFAPVATGNLNDGGRRQEPGSPLYNKPMTRSEALEALSATE
jgi:predicted dinucleotide-binding enzyme